MKLFYLILLNASMVVGQVIPETRNIKWEAGLKDGIPFYPVFADVTLPPYNASGNGIADDYQAISNAINDCPEGFAVFLPEGKYKISSSIDIRNKRIVVRGEGPDKTKLFGGIKINSWSSNKSAGLLNGFHKGSTTAITEYPELFNAGEFVLADQMNDSAFVTQIGFYESGCTWCGRDSGRRAMGQILKIKEITANNISFEKPFYMDFSSKFSPEITKISENITDSCGIEDLSIESGNDDYNIIISNSAFCWIKNIESKNANKGHIRLQRSYGSEVRDSYFHHARAYSSGSGYGVLLINQSSDNLIENNVFYYLRHSMVIEAGGMGNVFGYNYSERVFGDKYPDTDWLGGDMITHGAHPSMNLFEGNIAAKISLDNIWGSSSHNTFFRNHITGESEGENKEIIYGLAALNIEENNRYENIIGNVFGTENFSGVFEAIPFTSNSLKVIRKLGFHSPSATGFPSDSLVSETLLYAGNYDYATKTVLWENLVEQTLPSSLYLESKPAFFGNLNWPAAGPDVMPPVSPIPAQVRFDSLMNQGTHIIDIPSDKKGKTGGVSSFRTYPNPFNQTVRIRFDLSAEGIVEMKIYNSLGQLVKILSNGLRKSGINEVTFDASGFAGGVYFCRIEFSGHIYTQRMLLIK